MDPAEKTYRTVVGDGGTDSSAPSREDAEPGITESLVLWPFLSAWRCKLIENKMA